MVSLLKMSEDLGKFYIFAEDRQAYGPADSTLLQEWAQNGSVSPESWVYADKSDSWCRAKQISIIQKLLATSSPQPEKVTSPSGLKGGQLRRIRLFADMTDAQAEEFVNLVEKVKVRPFTPIVKQGEHGDSMFLILEGEARVSIKINDKEDTIAMLGVGDFFGEIALLDAGPRSADVTANKDCTLLQLSKNNFENIVAQNAELASRFLMSMNRYLGGRIRSTNEKFTSAQNFARGVSGQVSAPTNMKWLKDR
jgi:hypothetical protein